MKNKAPVAMVSVALLAGVLALLWSTGREPTPPPSPIALPETGCHATGRVLDAAGAPLSGAAVRATIVTPGAARESLLVHTDEDGSFLVRLFPPRGRWAFHVKPVDRRGFAAVERYEAAPGRIVRLTIREPDSPAAPPAAPNITGEVLDSDGRLLTGIPLIVTDKKGGVLARGVSGERGRVEFLLEEGLPFFVHAGELEEIPYQIDLLPCHDVNLILSSPDPVSDELMVDFLLPGSVPNEMARIQFYDDLGRRRLAVNRPIREGPHPVEGLPYGVYDIRVSHPGLAGAIQGFDFRPECRQAVVPLSATARVTGTLSERARVVLFSRSPTRVPVCREFRESDGENGHYRGAWEKKSDVDAFDWAGLPAADYRLRILSEGHETVEEVFTLTTGETRDFGRIDLVPATGRIRITITDQKERPDALEFPYVVRLYEVDGHTFVRNVDAGPGRTAEFRKLPAGSWMWRVERVLPSDETPGGLRTHATRRVGWDHPLTLGKGESKSVASDCTWRFGGDR